MNRLFAPKRYFTVPDGTDVSAFLNATDTSQTNIPWGALGEMSVAAGRIRPGVSSWIHMHPVVTMVTYLLSGTLVVKMKGKGDAEPYCIPMESGQAVITEPGTLFQLQNHGSSLAEVLYIVSPSYVFESSEDQIIYDDAVLVARTWEELEACRYEAPVLELGAYEAYAGREEAKRRLALNKNQKFASLSEDLIHSLPEKRDYSAPDGSEIRLLVNGDSGGLAHCLLPAGCTSAPVRHRTVEELWYVLEGEGEIWRRRDDQKIVHQIVAGDSLRISVDTSFQFRAGNKTDLKLLLTTMPPWPGPQEAVRVEGEWSITAVES